MSLPGNKTKIIRDMMIALVFMLALPLAMAPNMALAKRGDDSDNRLEFHGIVQARPENVLALLGALKHVLHSV